MATRTRYGRQLGLWMMAVTAAAVMLGGCHSNQRQEPVVRRTTPVKPAQPQISPQPMTMHMGQSAQAFPTGNRQSSFLLVEKLGPAQVRTNEPFEYTLRVTNLTDQPLEHVVVYDQKVREGFAMLPPQMIQDELRATGAQPWQVYGIARPGAAHHGAQQQDMAGEQPMEQAQRTEPWEVFGIPQMGISPEGAEAESQIEVGRWTVGTLGPKETRTLRVSGIADKPGRLQTCTTATYQPALCMATNVIAPPELSIDRIAPERASACDTIPVRYRVTNTGSSEAANIRLTENLPQGWRTEQGQSQVDFTVPRLGPGQSREFTINARVDQRGQYTGQAMAMVDGDQFQSSKITTVITKPQLEIKLTAPQQITVDQQVQYQIQITNTGDEAARDLTIRQTLPQAAQLLSSTASPQRQAQQLVWQLPALEPGQSTTVNASIQSDNPTRFTSTATADARCAEPASATASTQIQGLAALLLEVIDDKDPLRLGQTGRYEIHVTNQGNAPATNIRVLATLPRQLEYVTASGTTPQAGQLATQAQGQNVTFSIPTLEPGQTARLSVDAKANGAGDVRFEVKLTSDSLTSPVGETESTRLY